MRSAKVEGEDVSVPELPEVAWHGQTAQDLEAKTWQRQKLGRRLASAMEPLVSVERKFLCGN